MNKNFLATYNLKKHHSNNKHLSENKVLYMANLAGSILLKNGSETYRVEDAILRICSHYGLVAEPFATMTCILCSVRNYKGEIFSSVERIRSRTTNLNKLHETNFLIRNMNNLSQKEFLDKLLEIDNKKGYSDQVILFSYCGGAAFFSVLFGGGIHDFIAAGLGGFLLFWLNHLSDKLEINNFFKITMGGALCAFNSYLLFRIGFLSNTSISIIGTLMLLVPGMSFTNSIRDLIAGDLVSGISRGTEAAVIGACLAMGSAFALHTLLNLRGI
ncbi:MAG: threonine/serine exporter family protein [Fusobacteriaceae bacterium]